MKYIFWTFFSVFVLGIIASFVLTLDFTPTDNTPKEYATITVNGSLNSGEYVVGERAQFYASIDNFSYWVDEQGNFVTYDRMLDVLVNEDATYSAVSMLRGYAYSFIDEAEANNLDDVYADFNQFEYMYLDETGTLIISNSFELTGNFFFDLYDTYIYTYEDFFAEGYLLAAEVIELTTGQYVMKPVETTVFDDEIIDVYYTIDYDSDKYRARFYG